MKFTRTQEFIAEFFGTMVLILLGVGASTMVTLYSNNPPVPGGDPMIRGDYTTMVLGWGLGIMFGAFILPGQSAAPT